MKCEETGELLPDYLQGRLRADQAAQVEKHLAECAACGEEAALWKKLALLPEEQPSPALESRFKAMLESYQEGRWEKTNLASEKGKTVGPGQLETVAGSRDRLGGSLPGLRIFHRQAR
jgi:anti-sigma factor RsiW